MDRGGKWWYACSIMSGHHKKQHGAKKQDIMIMAMTFFVGAFAGFYLYATAFAPQFDELTGQTEEVYDDFVLEGSQYGGDRLGTAPSFQILANGSFRYLPYTADGEVAEAKEGVVPRALLREVTDTLTLEAVEAAAKIVTRGDCASYADGLDYKYAVSIKGDAYTIDTCTTDFRFDSTTFTTLDKLWNYFETVE